MVEERRKESKESLETFIVNSIENRYEETLLVIA